MGIRGLIAAVAASLLVVAMGAIASIASYMSSVPVAVAAKPLDRRCADCGVVVAVRRIELKGRDREAQRYQIRVRMSDGSVKTLTSSTQPGWKAGDRVRLQNGRLVG